MSIVNFYSDVIILIKSMLNTEDYINLSKTCKYLHKIISNSVTSLTVKSATYLYCFHKFPNCKELIVDECSISETYMCTINKCINCDDLIRDDKSDYGSDNDAMYSASSINTNILNKVEILTIICEDFIEMHTFLDNISHNSVFPNVKKFNIKSLYIYISDPDKRDTYEISYSIHKNTTKLMEIFNYVFPNAIIEITTPDV